MTTFQDNKQCNYLLLQSFSFSYKQKHITEGKRDGENERACITSKHFKTILNLTTKTLSLTHVHMLTNQKHTHIRTHLNNLQKDKATASGKLKKKTFIQKH